MNLRRKLIIVSSLTYILIFTGFLFYTNSLILEGYMELESIDIVKQTDIGLNTLDLRIKELNHLTKDYAFRDDTYYFIQDNMRHFINDLISSSSFIENEVNFMIFYDSQGHFMYSKGFDLSELRVVDVDEDVMMVIDENDALLNHTSRSSGFSGIIKVGDAPVMLSSHPIAFSDERLPPIGVFICGRYIDSIEIAKLREYSAQDLKIIEYDDSPIELANGVNVWRQDDNMISGLIILNDLNNDPVFILEVDSPRDLYMQGWNTVLYFYASMLSTGGVIGLLAIYMLNRFVVDRVLGLSKEVSSIDPKALESKTLSIPGDDEISKLSEDIDNMLQTIHEYQDLLTKRERMASIGEMAAMVGHDLRNPLQVIYMLGSRLTRAAKGLGSSEEMDPIVKELEYIKNNLSEQTEYMNKIVSDLQDFSKSITLQIEDIDVEELVVDVIKTLNAPENIEISVDFDEKSRGLRVDRNYFRRVLVNLLTNAVQAMPDGGKLTVSGRASDYYNFITVSDTGVGVSEENMEKLFTPLFTTKAKGTGLGLAISRRIVKSHGGEITVESTEGVGTAFTIRFSVRAAAEPKDIAEEETPDITEEEPMEEIAQDIEEKWWSTFRAPE